MEWAEQENKRVHLAYKLDKIAEHKRVAAGTSITFTNLCNQINSTTYTVFLLSSDDIIRSLI